MPLKTRQNDQIVPIETSLIETLFFWKPSFRKVPKKANALLGKVRINDGKTIHQNKRFTLRLHKDFQPEWGKSTKPFSMFFSDVTISKSNGKPVAFLESGNECYPAIVIEKNSIVLNFDIQKTINRLLREENVNFTKSLFSQVPFDYQIIPGSIRLFCLKRLMWYRQKMARSGFLLEWPIEKSVELLRYILLKIFQLVDQDSFKEDSFWPSGKRYCVLLTHDVDSDSGFKNIYKISDIEKSYGLTSLWNIVPFRYKINFSVLDNLLTEGHELGLHGYDHRNVTPFLPLKEIDKRIKKSMDLFHNYPIKGFRSESLMRSTELFQILEKYLLYDLSIPDTDNCTTYDTFNGCCSIFPFKINKLLEMPLTVPQDASLLVLGYSPNQILDIWLKKLDWIKKVKGLVVINTHPEPQWLGNKEMLKIYSKLLEFIRKDSDAWLPLPFQAAEWWLNRQEGECDIV